MHITGRTRTFMILGDPVAQVRAPEPFNHRFARAVDEDPSALRRLIETR